MMEEKDLTSKILTEATVSKPRPSRQQQETHAVSLEKTSVRGAIAVWRKRCCARNASGF